MPPWGMLPHPAHPMQASHMPPPPLQMWRNTQVVSFLDWLRHHNAGLPPERRLEDSVGWAHETLLMHATCILGASYWLPGESFWGPALVPLCCCKRCRFLSLRNDEQVGWYGMDIYSLHHSGGHRSLLGWEQSCPLLSACLPSPPFPPCPARPQHAANKVVEFLRGVDSDAAERAHRRYQCFDR